MSKAPTAKEVVGYAGYLEIDSLLNLQHPISFNTTHPAHDEMLFVIVHQAHELWFKQILFEINKVMGLMSGSQLQDSSMDLVVMGLERVTVIQKCLMSHLDVLETMTPQDFLEFRSLLSPASGFQSLQFRVLELSLGLHHEMRLPGSIDTIHSAMREQDRSKLKEVLKLPSLFQLVEQWLERTPFLEVSGYSFWKEYQQAVVKSLQQDAELLKSQPFISDDEKSKQLQELEKTRLNFEALFNSELHQEQKQKGLRRLSFKATHAALFINLYREYPALQLPFRLITALLDIDEGLQDWRAKHAGVVHRMIGSKIGTGGSSGFQYLKQTVDKYKVFSDLFNLSSYLLPKTLRPKLPANLENLLGFCYSSVK